MKFFSHIAYVFCVVVFSVLLIAQERPLEETASHEEVSESIDEAKTKQREAQERAEQAKKEQEEAKTDLEKKDAELREQQAMEDFYTAQIQEQKGVLELANQANDTETANKAQQHIDEATNNHEAVQKKIEELSEQLSKEFVSEKVAEITTDSALLNYTQQLAIGGYADEIIEKKLGYAAEVHSKIKELFDDVFVDNQLATIKSAQEKLGFLDNKRMTLEDALDVVQRELSELTKWSESHEMSAEVKEYKRTLEEMESYITQKKTDFDVQRASLELQNINLFSRIVASIKDWFNSTFEFHKKPWYKRSVDDEISKLSDIKSQVGRLQQATIGNFSDRVYDITEDITALEKQFKGYQEGKTSLDFDQFNENVTNVQKQLEALEPKEAQEAVDVYNTLYSESLQPMMGDMSAKLRRYKDPKFATLFDQTADYYSSNSIFGNTPYKPEQAYQALFTPEVIENLNTKNPGLNLTRDMFDPLSINPEAISPELIDKAYAETRAIYKEGTPIWRGARNASFLLRNPVDRATYDAFIKDYKTLLSQGIKNPYIGKENTYLNEQGALSKLQITQATKQHIESLWQDIIMTISQTKSHFDSIASSIERLGTTKQQLQSLSQDVAAFVQSQEQKILNGNS